MNSLRIKILIAAGSASLLIAGTRATGFAEDYPPTHDISGEQSSQDYFALPSQIEEAIKALAQPIDDGQLGRILNSIARTEDPQEQERLQRLLDERIGTLMSQPSVASETTTQQSQVFEPNNNQAQQVSDEELTMRIQSLKLGPDATIDDLRSGDEIVTTIAGIKDPIKREQFLQQLEERERAAETAIYRPTEKDSK